MGGFGFGRRVYIDRMATYLDLPHPPLPSLHPPPAPTNLPKSLKRLFYVSPNRDHGMVVVMPRAMVLLRRWVGKEGVLLVGR